MVRIEGENLRPVTWVVIDEVAGGNWAIGGKPLMAAEYWRWRTEPPCEGVGGVEA